MSKAKILILGTIEHLAIVSPLFRVLRERYLIKETEDTTRFIKAMQGEIDLAIVFGPAPWFSKTIQEARAQGSKVPVIFIWIGAKKKPPRMEKVRNVKASILPSKLLEMAQEELGE